MPENCMPMQFRGTEYPDAISLRSADGSSKAVNYVVRKSPRARYIRLTLDYSGSLILTLPRRASIRDGLNFIKQQKSWIFEQQKNFKPPQTALSFLKRRPWLGHQGKKIPLYFVLGSQSNGLNDKSRSRIPYLQFNLIEGPEMDQAFLKLLRKWARYSLVVRAADLAFQSGLDYRALSIRDQKSRWGSCSQGKNLSLNWRLILLDPTYQDYIIFHELAHLKEMNHGPRFWALLEKICPGAEKMDCKLTRLSLDYRLMSIGRIEKHLGRTAD